IEEIKVFLEKFRCSSIKRKASILQNIDRKKAAAQHSTKMPELKKKEVKQLKKIYQKELVKRSAVSKIISAWLITVPISAIIGTISYFALSALNF
ncbi:MAG: inorganic phosphate transporter, partial [Helicobacter sp.]|nr:inorganic phosphate transporter [Helicobacter sp.]